MSNVLDRLGEIVGSKNVNENQDYCSLTAGFAGIGSDLQPDYVVKPETSEQVQKIVQLANELSFPIIPVSSKSPHTTGGSKPQLPGSIILDLSGMNKILKVNRRHQLALIQPGVTWEELSIELKNHGLRIPQPLLPKNGKSVIASLLDREPLLSPKYQWNMTEPLRSMEIIFGNGSKIYSGMGGHRGETDQSWEDGTVPVTNAGPHQFDFMKMVTASQGTMGIVTWASVKVEPIETQGKVLFFETASLDQLVEALHKIVKYRFGDEVFILNRKGASAILGESEQERKDLESRLAPWIGVVSIKWGGLRTTEKITTQTADIMDIAQEAGLVSANTLAGLPSVTILNRFLSLSGENAWKQKTAEKYKEVFFLTTMDKLKDQLEVAGTVANTHHYAMADCPVYIQPLHQGVAAHCQLILPCTDTQIESPDMKEFYDDLSSRMMNAGAFYSRPYGVWANLVYEKNTGHADLTKKMKDIFDPNHIMNPGKLCF